MPELLIIRWAFAALLGLFGVYCIGLNYGVLYVAVFRKEHHSLGPLLGGCACAVALLVCPVRVAHRWAWLPLVLDPGCLLALMIFLYAVFVLKAFKRAA